MLLWLFTAAAHGASPVEFNRDVRPILSDKCYACHGPDAKTREAELRLDQRAEAIRDLGESQAIKPNHPEASELIKRVSSKDSDEIMPPAEHGKPLTAEEISILRKWIKQGAKYQLHWSLTPVKKPILSGTVQDHSGNAIDTLIQKRLKQTKLSLNSAADPRTLIRRLSFDLTGLPPAPNIVTQFVKNPTDEAYAALVESLLHSSHYGERMAIYWLDLVRYADTLGYHGDQVRSVSPYRDYVIRAFNENKPFDQFTIEQLAGDLLPQATLWQKVASTYNRLNRASAEGGVQPKEYLAKYSADRVRTTGSVWLGMTFGCAECHDHKFDPFTTKDFYRFAAFFADIKELGIVSGAKHLEKMPVPTKEQAEHQQKLADQLRIAEAEYNRSTPEVSQARSVWEQAIRNEAESWVLLKPTGLKSDGGATLTLKKDNSVLASGKNPARDTYQIVVRPEKDSPLETMLSTKPAAIKLRLELLPDPALPNKGPGRAGNGNLVLNRIEATLGGKAIKWQTAYATHTQKNHSPDHLISGHKNGWAILPQTGKPQQLLLAGQVSQQEEKQKASVDSSLVANSLVIKLVQNHGASHNLGRFRLSLSTSKPDAGIGPLVSYEITQLINIDQAKRTKEQTQKLNSVFREQTPLLAKERQRMQTIRQEQKQLQASISTTLVTKSVKPRMMRVLPRGDWMDDSGEVVKPGVPHFLSQPEIQKDQQLTRLDLARWMTAKNNPLVARTFVNRMWMLMFGHGLARNVDDLGSQGEMPTHPELLDWLAAEFIESGWDVKHLIRTMVLSKSYRQSSYASKALQEQDPYNRLFARQSRWRLEAEMVRDNALSVSGLLNKQVGGVSVKPYQPAGYWAQLNFPKRNYQHDQGADQYRRGFYTHWQRTFLHPSLLAFDAPAREECAAQRSRSNTPLQVTGVIK